ncbi:MAG: TRZ/ATZ family hydrolase [Gammaproteobacteria bacterium]|nr:TRZ/ATZ family hydrolase [Gammaproteobacteria bacterium]
MQIDTLITAKWIIPVEPKGLIYQDYAIAVHEGRIIELLPISKADRYQPTNRIDLNNQILMPGLINAHGHAAMSLMRGIADDLPLMEWLNEHIWPAEQKYVDAEFVYDGSLLACAEMLRGGTTCFNDMYFYPEETARAAEHAGMRAVVGLIVINFPSAWAQDADEYLSKGIQLHDELRNNSLIKTAFAPHAPYTVADAPLEKIRTLAEELDIPVHIHVHETAHEVEEAEKEYQIRPLQRLENLGLLTPHLVSVHMTQLTDEEITRYADSGAHVVHCPESNLKLASGFCPLDKLIKSGINVALGTDGAASNNDLDMFGEMRTAALLAKAVAGDASAVPAEEVLRMATINGAKALGLDEETGSLEVGKAADIIAVDMSGIETTPLYEPISQLVYSTGRDRVTNVWVAGKHVLKDRELTTLDTEAILDKANQWYHKLAE